MWCCACSEIFKLCAWNNRSYYPHGCYACLDRLERLSRLNSFISIPLGHLHCNLYKSTSESYTTVILAIRFNSQKSIRLRITWALPDWIGTTPNVVEQTNFSLPGQQHIATEVYPTWVKFNINHICSTLLEIGTHHSITSRSGWYCSSCNHSNGNWCS